MAKKMNGTAKWVSISLAILLAAGTVTINILGAHADTKANSAKIETVKKEGCLPARATDSAIRVINSRFDSFEKSQDVRFESMEKAQVVRDETQTKYYEAIMNKLDK